MAHTIFRREERMKRFRHFSLLALFCVALFSFDSFASLKVVCTLSDLALIAKEVGGEHVEVKALLSKNQDPHYADPRPSIMLTLSSADLLCVNGLQLEDAWLQNLVKGARNPNIMVGARGFFNAALNISTFFDQNRPTDRVNGDIHPGGNPHFTLDPRRAAEIARGLATAMSRLDPEHTEAFNKNVERFQNEVDALTKSVNERRRAIAKERRAVVSYHRSLPYLFDYLGIEDVIQVEPKPGIPPNPRHMARVLKTMKARGLKVIVQERYFPTSISEKLTGLRKGKLVLIDGGGDFEKERYIDAAKRRCDAILSAL